MNAWNLLLLCLVFAVGCAKAQPPPPQAAAQGAAAGQFLELLVASRFEEATALFGPRMRQRVSAHQVEESWTRLLDEHGAFKSRGEARQEEAGALEAVYIPTELERSSVTLKVVFQGAEIVGYFYLPTGPAPAVAPVGQLPADAAKEFVEELAAGKFAVAAARFDDTMRAALPTGKLAELWASLVATHGPFQNQLGLQNQSHGPYEIILVGCQFQKAAIDLKVVFTKTDGRIAGLFTVPRYVPAPTVRPESFTEAAVVVGADPWRLPGTLTLPKGDGPFPALVLVHGSGPNDRDETIGPNKPFRDLAEGLAARGVAVLRYDKRTLVHAGRFAALPSFTVKEETVDDAVAAVAMLKATPGVDAKRIFVLGHSLGGELAPRIGRAAPEIAGLVVLAGSTRPTSELIIEQTAYIASLDGTVSEAEQAQLARLKGEAERVLALTADSTETVLGAPASYWLDLRGQDAPALARTLRQPMLILQGERDYQVTMEDFAGWKRALGEEPRVSFKSYPKLNHLFLPGEGAKSVPAEYQRPGNVPAEVLDDIAAWIKAH